MVNYNTGNAGGTAFSENGERRMTVRRPNDRKKKFNHWIENAALCFWQAVEAVSGRILFV